MKPSLVVFLHSHRYDRIYQATSLLLTASSMGWPCHLCLFYGALASYTHGTWDEVNLTSQAETELSGPTTSPSPGDHPASELGADALHTSRTPAPPPAWLMQLQKSFEESNFPSLYDMLQKARLETGKVRVYACSTSCKTLQLDIEVVREKVDEIVGLPTMLQIVEKAKHVIYI